MRRVAGLRSSVGLCLPALALASCFLAVAATAGPLPDGGITAQEMAARLSAFKFPVEITTDPDGDPLIKSNNNAGTKFSVYFYECSGKPARCKSFQFAAGFTGVGPNANVPEWNRAKRFGRAYLDKVGDPWVEMDVDVQHGATTEAIANDIDRWLLVIKEFKPWIGFR